MKHTIVNMSQLGECWSAAKFCTNCVGCDKYDTCKLPDRNRDPQYDALYNEVTAARAYWKARVKELQNYSQGEGYDNGEKIRAMQATRRTA